MQLQQEKQITKLNLLRKCGLLAHTSPTFLKNCWIKKLLFCLRLILGKPSQSGSARLGHIPSLPWESQLPLKPCILLQPLDFIGNCDSFDFLLDSYCCLLPTLCRGQLSPAPLAELSQLDRSCLRLVFCSLLIYYKITPFSPVFANSRKTSNRNP